jgi:hypothetical protein
LRRDIFEKVVLRTKTETAEMLMQTAAGTIREREARIDSFSTGVFTYKDAIFGQSNLSCLGLLFLSRHLVTFDFPNSKIYLKKGKDFEKVDETDMSGLHLLRISNKVFVHSVDCGSPAEKAGIRAKDIIVRIGDKDANSYEMFELRRLLMSKDKRRIAMTIQSGDEVKTVSFRLRKKL